MTEINELDPTLLSLAALNPWIQHISSPRSIMFTASHLKQALGLETPTVNRVQSGVEKEYGKYTFSIKAPCDLIPIKLVKKFPTSIGKNSIKNNPTHVLIYEDMETLEVGMINLLHHSCEIDTKHQHYGFVYKYNDSVMNDIFNRRPIKKGTIIADSNNKNPNGTYMFGIDAKVAFLGVRGIIEDGIVISESCAKRLAVRRYEKRTCSFGKKYFPLNLYGDEDNYKPFPDIGDKIRPDGLLYALRRYNEDIDIVQMDINSLREPDTTFDKLTYGVPNAVVTNIDINHNDSNPVSPTSEGMVEQLRKYYDANMQFHLTILEVYNDLLKQRRKDLNISPEFHRQVVMSMGFVGVKNIPDIKKHPLKDKILKRKVIKTYRRASIDDWHVTVHYEKVENPGVTFKLTTMHGGKGVVCAVWPDDRMPVDLDGNRAEIILDGDSIIKRMNIGVLYEHYIKGSITKLTKRIREIAKNSSDYYSEIEPLILRFYEITNPRQLEVLSKTYPNGDYREHIDSLIKDGIYLWIPTNNQVESVEMVKQLKEEFEPCHEPVMYNYGEVTDRPVLIADLYILLLEKTGKESSGVSSSKLQHFGIPAKLTMLDKHSNPCRNNPIRVLGETEVRSMSATCGSDVVAEILDISNSPTSTKEVLKSIMESDTPTNIDSVIDRDRIPLGNNRANAYINHILECGGIRFNRTIDDKYRQEDIDRKRKGEV